MRCDEVRSWLGTYVDGELAADVRAAIHTHLGDCVLCQREVRQLRCMADSISAGCPCEAPPELWGELARRLDSTHRRPRRRLLLRLRPIEALAACLFLALGAGFVFFSRGFDLASPVQAAPVNFGVLLDAVSIDPERAFRQFVELYKGHPVQAGEARQHARELNFAIPDVLPGEFQLQNAFALRIGDAPAAAARYLREGELLVVIFHRAIHPEDYGTHRDHPCVVGEHRGQRVEVGEWRLVHVTDATTCHCVLSRLDETRELQAVLRAVAPDFQPGADQTLP